MSELNDRCNRCIFCCNNECSWNKDLYTIKLLNEFMKDTICIRYRNDYTEMGDLP